MSSPAQPQPDCQPPPPNVYHPSAAHAPAYDGYADPAAAHGWQNAYDETRELPVAVGEAPSGRGRGSRRRRGRRGRRAAVAVGAVGAASLAAVVAGLLLPGSSDAPQGRHGRTASTAGGETPAPVRSASPLESPAPATAPATPSLPATGGSTPGAAGDAPSAGGAPDRAVRSASPAPASATPSEEAPVTPATVAATVSTAPTAPARPGNSRGHGRGSTKGPK